MTDVIYIRGASRVLQEWLGKVQAQRNLRSKSAAALALLEACRQQAEGVRGRVDIAEVAEVLSRPLDLARRLAMSGEDA